MSGTGETPPIAIVTTYHSLAAATKIIIERDEEIAELIRERDEAQAKLDAWDGLKRQEANEAEQRGYRKGVEDAVRLAREHRARVPNHHPDEPMDDLVAQGYGNAALNLECAILALLEQTGEPGEKK